MPRTKLTKPVKDSTVETVKPEKKTLKKIPEEWKDRPCSQTATISIMNMAILSKAIYILKAIFIKCHSNVILHISRKEILKFIWEYKTCQINKAILGKNNS